MEQSVEVARLENLINVAESKYARDISKLQQALLRTRRLGNIHIVGLHLKMIPLYEATSVLPLECSFYRWKRQCEGGAVKRYEPMGRVLRYLYKKTMIKKFVLFREQAYRSIFIKVGEGNEFAKGSLPPLSAPDDDELSY